MKKLFTFLLILILTVSLTAFTASANELQSNEAAEESLFEEIYDFFITNADKIFAILAFSASILLAFAYKRGLIPLLKSALGSLKSSVVEIKDEAEKSADESTVLLTRASENLGQAELLLESLSERLCEIDGKLSETANCQSMIAVVESVLASQTELLYEIFMSSSLPLYQKESVGEKISEMKRKLAIEKQKRGD